MSFKRLVWTGYMIVGLTGCGGENPTSPPPGPQWVIFNTGNSPLPASGVRCLALDGAGAVWCGTDSGAISFLAHTWNVIQDSLGFLVYFNQSPYVATRYTVNSIASGKSGVLWFGLDGGGARRYNRFSQGSVWMRFGPPDIPSANVTAIAADLYIRGDVFVCTTSGVAHYTPSTTNPDAGVWQTVPPIDLPSTNVHAAVLTPGANAFVFGTLGGASVFDGVASWSKYYFPAYYNSPITSIAVDLSNTAWFGKWSGASRVNLNNTNDASHYTVANTGGSLPSGYVNAVATDLHATRWFGTYLGLVRLRDTVWTTFTRANSPLPTDSVTALTYDQRGNLWIGTTGGVAVYNELGTRL